MNRKRERDMENTKRSHRRKRMTEQEELNVLSACARLMHRVASQSRYESVQTINEVYALATTWAYIERIAHENGTCLGRPTAPLMVTDRMTILNVGCDDARVVRIYDIAPREKAWYTQYMSETCGITREINSVLDSIFHEVKQRAGSSY